MVTVLRQLPHFHQIVILRESLRRVSSGGSGLVSMADKHVMERAFFPGGNGLMLGEDAPRFPVDGTLVLGSNFGADEKFCTPDGELLCVDETNNPGTWVGLRKRFTTEQLEDCFFTNAWPFLHTGASNNPDGSVKQGWLRDSVLMGSCLEFFRTLLRELRPSLIVALGTAPAAFISYAFPEALAGWSGNAWRCIDQQPTGIVQNGIFTSACVAITHPSMSNAHLRIEDFGTAAKERELLQRAIQSGEKIRRDRSGH